MCRQCLLSYKPLLVRWKRGGSWNQSGMSSLNVADVCKLIISTNGRCTNVHTFLIFLMEFKSCSDTFQVHVWVWLIRMLEAAGNGLWPGWYSSAQTQLWVYCCLAHGGLCLVDSSFPPRAGNWLDSKVLEDQEANRHDFVLNNLM